MKAKNRLALLAAAALLLVSLTGCNTSSGEEPAGNDEVSQTQSEDGDANENPDTDPDEDPQEEEPQEDYVTGTAGSLQYTYPDGLTVREIGYLSYIYYNNTSFFFVETTTLPLDQQTMGAREAEAYYVAAEQSFNETVWTNGRMITDIVREEINGLEIWTCEIAMDHENGMSFTSTMAVLSHEGRLIVFALISDTDSYEESISKFSKTLDSLQAV